MGDIRYIDHVDTDELRARYATHVGFDIDAIVPIDYVTHGSIYDTVGPDIPFDYVIVSHVIEHVPDVVGWLGDIRSVLSDDGVLSLAIPDHRRCFDALRSPTVTADLHPRGPHEANDPLAAAGLRSLLVSSCVARVDLVGPRAAVRRARTRPLRGGGTRTSHHRLDIG